MLFEESVKSVAPGLHHSGAADGFPDQSASSLPSQPLVIIRRRFDSGIRESFFRATAAETRPEYRIGDEVLEFFVMIVVYYSSGESLKSFYSYNGRACLKVYKLLSPVMQVDKRTDKNLFFCCCLNAFCF